MAELIIKGEVYSEEYIKLLSEYYRIKEEEVIKLLKTPRIYYLVSLSYNVPPGKYVEMQDNNWKAIFHGSVEKIFINFPKGCNGKVDLRVWVGDTPIFPTKGWLSLEDYGGWFDITYPVRAGEYIYAEIKNRGAYPHNITVLVLVSNRLVVWKKA